MKQVETYDGSITLYSEKYKECFHSKSGAIEEAFEKFVKPCRIKSGMRVLDICFGLGYNSLAAIHSAGNLKIIALENDPKVLKEIQGLEVNEELKDDFEIIKKAARDHYYNNGSEIKLILGDAVESIKTIEKGFDAVFHDPFSVPKNPELWSYEFFKDVRNLMNENAILATYSYARKVRENLAKAGFIVEDGPIIGRRSPSTIATNRKI